MSTFLSTTLVTNIKVNLDKNKPFVVWQEKMNAAVSQFPGFISLEMRPLPKERCIEWTHIQRFHTSEELEKWRYSEIRKNLLLEVEPFLIRKGAVEERESQSYDSESVTEVFVTRVTPENYDAYRAWASKIQQVEAQFPGYLGIYVQAPEKTKEGNWITILRFASSRHLDAWLHSEERKAILKESESIVKEVQSHRVASSFAGWFATSTGEVPPVWKQTMLVLLVLFPLVMLELLFLMPVTQELPLSLATFIGNAISVTLVSWPLMPLVIRCLQWWVFPGLDHRLKKNIVGTVAIVMLYFLEIAIFWAVHRL